MKQAVIVHGWGGSPEEPMLKWLKKKLEERGYAVSSPNMPNPNYPDVRVWPKKLEGIIKPSDETLIIGHSVGCFALLRYLENLPKKVKIGKCIFIAPWIELDKETIKEEGPKSVEIMNKWTENQVNWDDVKNACKKFICIFSDNDPFVVRDNWEIFRVELNAKTIILKKRGHFDPASDVKNLPEILQFLD